MLFIATTNYTNKYVHSWTLVTNAAKILTPSQRSHFLVLVIRGQGVGPGFIGPEPHAIWEDLFKKDPTALK